MHGLNAADILEAVDRAGTLHRVDAALMLATFAHPDASFDDLAQMSLGARDRLLLHLRAATFGRRLEMHVDCVACGTTLEIAHHVDDLDVGDPDDAMDAEIAIDGRAYRLRAADSFALAAAASAPTLEAGRAAIASYCLEPADGIELAAPPVLTAEVLDAIAERMAILDPQADLVVALTCPDCGEQWTVSPDIADLFCRELEIRGQRIFDDVHDLASRYHWSEAEILALTPARRGHYLNLIRS